MTATTSIMGFAVVEQTTVTDAQGNVVSQTSFYRVATAAEVQAIFAAVQKGQPTVAAATPPAASAT